jgi:hypothetical protein
MGGVTVTCVWVRGEYPYTADYVTRLRDMVTRWMDRPFRFVCLTDQPEALPDVETITVEKLAGFAPWTKLELFRPCRQWIGRVLYLDLDSLIVAPLSDLIDTQAVFAITSDPWQRRNRTHDAYGHAIVRRFNSSVMVWDGGTHTHLYTEWVPDVVNRLSGDQDWIGERLPYAYAWPRDWFPRLSELNGRPPTGDAKVVLVKVPKNHIAAETYPWFAPLWGAA